MSKHLPLLIIGAGPYGLAMSALARERNIDHLVVGKPMDFWKSNMPQGMYLRSACDWHYDPSNVDTMEAYLGIRGIKPTDFTPIALDAYLKYCDWFQVQKGIQVRPTLVQQLDYADGAFPYFQATLDDGDTVTAENVVLALGFKYFKNIPEPYSTMFPPQRITHTCDAVDLERLRGKRVLIIGGRQSAFEWAALLHEQGAEAVYLSYRHPTPAFATSDWTWVNPIVDSFVTDPGWYRRLSEQEKKDLGQRFWAEGRLKLEPWLAPRIHQDSVHLFPESQVVGCRDGADGALQVELDGGQTLDVDQIILATGYKVNLERVPLLTRGNVLRHLQTENGFPVLDERLESNVPGLFFTSMCATQDFGPFFAFTAAVRTAAQLIGVAISQEELA